MSNYLAIATVTSALQHLILKGLQSAQWGFAYELGVTVNTPEAARPQALDSVDQINLFLYQALPNAAWRNEVLPAQVKKGEQGFPPLALDLYYLITAYTPNDDGLEAHRLLGRALSVLHDHAVLSATELQAALLHADVHQQVERIRLSPHPLTVEEMSKLWGMFQRPYRMSVAWQVSVVLIDSTRPARAPLPVLTRGASDRGVAVQPDLEPVTPGLDLLSFPKQQPSAVMGDVLSLTGHRLADGPARVALTHSRWSSAQYLPPSTVTARSASVTLPTGGTADASLPAGLYTLALAITRQPGDSEFLTNALPFSLAPTLVSITPTHRSPDDDGVLVVTATASPQVRPDQRVSLIVGHREFKADALTAQGATLSFRLTGLPPGKYRLRLRVDGVDSLVVDRSKTPPVFIGPELEVA
ncbi:DUF4255 domain-containing protein [Corallococcus exercitus]|uniref:DUF4255 domain-containing protein n=1 Tax=Corallococcus exercitus TaxID=2316736 RepID=A0A7Y4KKL5_9BACT|nr:DUF4255 domain-containing protein [Corallococcus exercitus]